MSKLTIYTTALNGLAVIGKNWDAALRDIDNPVSEDYVPGPSTTMTTTELQNWMKKLDDRMNVWSGRSTSGNSKEQANAATIYSMLEAKYENYDSLLQSRLQLNNGGGNPTGNGNTGTPPIVNTDNPTVTTATGTDTKKYLTYGLIGLAAFLLIKNLSSGSANN